VAGGELRNGGQITLTLDEVTVVRASDGLAAQERVVLKRADDPHRWSLISRSFRLIHWWLPPVASELPPSR
jgi:hypothetical protein